MSPVYSNRFDLAPVFPTGAPCVAEVARLPWRCARKSGDFRYQNCSEVWRLPLPEVSLKNMRPRKGPHISMSKGNEIRKGRGRIGRIDGSAVKNPPRRLL